MNAKLFIQKNKVNIANTKKRETISYIPYFIIFFTNTWFKTSGKGKNVADKLSEKDNTDKK